MAPCSLSSPSTPPDAMISAVWPPYFVSIAPTWFFFKNWPLLPLWPAWQPLLATSSSLLLLAAEPSPLSLASQARRRWNTAPASPMSSHVALSPFFTSMPPLALVTGTERFCSPPSPPWSPPPPLLQLWSAISMQLSPQLTQRRHTASSPLALLPWFETTATRTPFGAFTPPPSNSPSTAQTRPHLALTRPTCRLFSRQDPDWRNI